MEGDFILLGKQEYSPWNTPVTGTVFVNDHAISTFVGPERQVVITDLLKKGENTVKFVSERVPNIVTSNDVKFQVAGPAEYNVGQGRFDFRRVVQFEAMQGWKWEDKSGKLVKQAKGDGDSIEREIKFTLDHDPGKK